MEIHSNKIPAQILSAALIKAGIRDVVISPGSRNAPLIIELTNRKELENYSVVDERSAGFFALGIAQQKRRPVVLVCTSGSALLNYYPAVAEAFYSQIPLIVVSADRPQKWVDQGEGQTIRQHNVFANHSWYNTTLPEEENSEAVATVEKEIRRAIETAIDKQGPVHINMPFDEPLYKTVQKAAYDFPVVQTDFPARVYEENFLENFARIWQSSAKKMILAGQHAPSEFLQTQLEKLSEDPSVIVLNENISNVHGEKFINNIDQAIFPLDETQLQAFQPEILITIGRNIISKKIKKFLRQHPPQQHWHIEKTALPPDTFEVLSQHFDTTPEMFFSQFLFLVSPSANSGFQQQWLSLKHKHKLVHHRFLEKAPYSDLKVFETITRHIPPDYIIHWGNSSTVRYAQLFDYLPDHSHFSNRGTSGIDGSTSTAIGAARASHRPVLMMSGDISFLYDSNALWNKYIPGNFKLIVINNGGGDIFNFIPGPARTRALNDFFVTKHLHKARHLAAMYGFQYHTVNNIKDLSGYLPVFFNNDKQPQLLEIDTSKAPNSAVLKAYFNGMK